MSDIIYEIEKGLQGDVALITLDRPKALNALTHEMIISLTAHLKAYALDDNIKAVVVKSNSDKAFCAGGDVVGLYNKGKDAPEKAIPFFNDEYRLNYFINQFDKPYICLLDGITMGGGVGISLHGNFPIATENFNFAMPETGIGFFPDIGGGYLLSRCHDYLGTYLGLTGNRIGRDDALASGLIKYGLEKKDIDAFIAKVIDCEIAKDSNEAVREVLHGFGFNPAESELAKNKDEINTHFSQNSVEEIFDSLEKGGSEFALKTLSILKKKSPLSLKITYQQIERAKHLSMGDCMKMDFRLVNRFIAGSDFYEGVRALLIDKDKSPKWQYQQLSEISKDEINHYFASLEDNELLIREA